MTHPCTSRALIHSYSTNGSPSAGQGYIDASALFPFNKPCTAPPATFGSFVTQCVQEQSLLSRQNLTALQLRAFLYNCDGFNALFTGYGYTAEEYGLPLVREFWVHNKRVDELPAARVLDFHVRP